MTVTPKAIVEAALLVAGEPLSVDRLRQSVLGEFGLSRKQVLALLEELGREYAGRGVELKEVASGYRFQARAELAPWLARLSQEKPPRYSRAVLETLALIAYRQPITRGEIEAVRGVSVSSQIIQGLRERGWIQVVGNKEVPGRPALYGTTKAFLDYFSLTSLDQLPTLDQPQAQDQLQALEQALLDKLDSDSTSESVSQLH